MYKNLAMLLGMLCLDSGIVLASVVEVDLKNFLFNCESATCESLPGSDEMLNASFEWNTATGAPVPDTMSVNAVGILGGFNYVTTNNPGSMAPQFVFQDSSLDKIVISPCCQLPGDTVFFPTIGAYFTQALIVCGSTTDACGTGSFAGLYQLRGEMDVTAVPEPRMPVEIIGALITLAVVAGSNRHTREGLR